MEYRVETIIDLIARNQCDRRSILQLGYKPGAFERTDQPGPKTLLGSLEGADRGMGPG